MPNGYRVNSTLPGKKTCQKNNLMNEKEKKRKLGAVVNFLSVSIVSFNQRTCSRDRVKGTLQMPSHFVPMSLNRCRRCKDSEMWFAGMHNHSVTLFASPFQQTPAWIGRGGKVSAGLHLFFSLFFLCRHWKKTLTTRHVDEKDKLTSSWRNALGHRHCAP
jgi:hypothetical protein